MTDEQIHNLASTIHQHFDDKPTRQAQIQLVERGGNRVSFPTTWTGWLTLISLSATIIGGLTWGVVKTSSMSAHVDKPATEYVMHKMERYDEAIARFNKHLTDDEIHQDGDAKRLNTILAMKPFERSMNDMQSQMTSVQLQLVTVLSALSELKEESKAQREYIHNNNNNNNNGR